MSDFHVSYLIGAVLVMIVLAVIAIWAVTSQEKKSPDFGKYYKKKKRYSPSKWAKNRMTNRDELIPNPLYKKLSPQGAQSFIDAEWVTISEMEKFCTDNPRKAERIWKRRIGPQAVSLAHYITNLRNTEPIPDPLGFQGIQSTGTGNQGTPALTNPKGEDSHA